MGKMLTNENIICFANDWKGDPTSKHQVMKILSRDRKVLWVNSISMRSPKLNKSDLGRIKNKLKSFFSGLEQIKSNLYVFTPIVLPFPESSLVRKINYYILLLSLAFFVKKLELKPFQLWSFIPTMTNLVGHLGESKVVYYCVDEWSKFSFLDGKLMRRLEQDLLKKSDLVITTAKTLFEDKVTHNKNTFLIPHGVDFEHFAQTLDPAMKRPDDIVDMSGPIIGFFGLIHEWIDLDLISYIAENRPDWQILLIGKSSVDITDIAKRKNVHFIGQRSYEVLPRYCKAMDGALIPFKINELTIHVNPIKLREYLSAGLPVVSTPLPEVMQYSHLVEIGDGNKDFLNKIAYCLHENNNFKKQERVEAMKGETWEAKVNYLIKLTRT